MKQVILSLFILMFSVLAMADDNGDGRKPKISDIQTAYKGDLVEITINGINFLGKKGVAPFVTVGNGVQVSLVAPALDKKLIINVKASDLLSNGYLLYVSKDDKFSPEKSDFFDMTLGVQGPAGPKGDTGLQGTIGLTGSIGPQGVQGVKGDLGPQGVKGDTGLQGSIGLTGLTGADGQPGAAGQKGDAGSFPQGVADGDMQYWDGTAKAWVMVPKPTNDGATLTFCNGKPTWTPCHIYKIGDTGPGGGKVFYVEGSGTHGLESHLNSLPNGKTYTWQAAMDAAQNLGNGWRLPTKTELQLMFEQRQILAPMFISNGQWEEYWSSTYHTIGQIMWIQRFNYGSQETAGYSALFFGHPIRSF